MALLKQITAAILLGLVLALGTGFLADIVYQTYDPGGSANIEEDVAAEEPAIVEEAPTVAEEPESPEEPNAEEAATLGALLTSATADQGQRLFGRCRACHDNSAGGNHKIGPNLYGIVGAEVGRFGDYNYSNALSTYDGVWVPALLDAYLASPKDAIPGNKMAFGGLAEPADRAALIVYLNGLSENPLDLSE